MLIVSVQLHAQFIPHTTKHEIYDAINKYRIENGLHPLKVSKGLEISSALYAFTEKTKNTGQHSKWFAKRRKVCAELMGHTYKPVDDWKKSYAHNRVLQASGFTHMGTGKSGGLQVIRFIKKD